MDISQFNRPGLAVLIATLALSSGAWAQYAPYGTPYQQPPQTYSPQIQVNQQPAQTNASQSNALQSYVPSAKGPQMYSPQSSAPQSYAPQYMAMMYQADNDAPTLSQPLESVPPGPMQQSAQPSQPMSVQQYEGAETTMGGEFDGQAATQPGYAQPSYGAYGTGSCNSGGCGGWSYNTFADGCNQGCFATGDVCYSGMCGGCTTCRPRHHWFGGVYGLLMDRVDCSNKPLAFQTTMPAVGYYPTDSEIVLTTQDIDTEIQGGAEVRFGATCSAFGGGCGYGSCCGCGNGGCGALAWEVGYWGLFREDTYAMVADTATFGTDGNRTYGMIDFRGLEYNSGAGYRPVNDYFDYGPPTTDNTTPYDVEIRQLSVRNKFAVQNLELNLMRLPLLGGGCATTCCDSCVGGPCNTGGCAVGGCGSCCQRCQVTTLLGIRYLRVDDDFWLRSDFERMDTNALNYLAYNVEADNQLVGFQVGANGAYYLGPCCRFALQCSTNAGIYGNRAEVTQWMAEGTGVTRFANGTNADFYTNYDNTDLAFLGELRLGASYQCTCNCRLYAGYRILGVSGVAVAIDQIPTAFITPAQVGAINCNGAYILHGLQTGLEFCY